MQCELTGKLAKRIFDRIVKAECGCWIWTGKRNGKSTPIYIERNAHGKCQYRCARRILFHHCNPGLIGRYRLEPTCENGANCVNPGHCRAISESQFFRSIGGSRSGAKLDWEKVSEIRLRHKEPLDALAAEFGVTPKHISRIIKFKIWKVEHKGPHTI